MIFSYTFCRMKRNPGPTAAVCLLGLLIALALSILHMSAGKMELEIDELYEKMEVRCAVTNLTGTQTDNLNLRDWVVGLFLHDTTTLAGEPLDQDFASFVRDVRVKTSLNASGGRLVVGVTDLEMDGKMLPENGCKITWLEDCGPEIFAGREPLCLLPEESFLACPPAENGARCLDLQFQSGYSDIAAERQLRVAGYYTGGSGAIYCPWRVAEGICVEINGSISADSICATVRNNRELAEFRDCAYRWFASVDPSGTPQPWEASPIYAATYPYAFEIYDSVLRQTEQTLHNNIVLMRLASRVILGLSLAIGFLAGFLLIRNRAKELALMQTLGTGKCAIFFQAFLEQALPTTLGVVLTAAGFAAVSTPPATQLALFLCFDFAGAAAAIGWFLRQNLLTAIKEENE